MNNIFLNLQLAQAVVENVFTQMVGADFTPETTPGAKWNATSFLAGEFGGSSHDEDDRFTTFMEQITGNFGRPDPVESIIAEYYGLTEEIIDTILAAIDT